MDVGKWCHVWPDICVGLVESIVWSHYQDWHIIVEEGYVLFTGEFQNHEILSLSLSLSLNHERFYKVSKKINLIFTN